MKYLATYRSGKEERSRSYTSLERAIRFLCQGMNDGSLWPGEIIDMKGRTVVSHERIMQSWLDVVAGDAKPADLTL